MDEKQLLCEEKLLGLLEQFLQEYVQSTGQIGDAAKAQEEYLEKVRTTLTETIGSDAPETDKILEGFSSVQQRMAGELEKSRQKIRELEQQLGEARTEMLVDELTRVKNRKAMERDLASACAKETAFSLIMLDADDFKKINDQFGHLAGDKVLIYVAKTLKNLVRNKGVVYRYGGEEFLLFLPKTPLGKATDLAETIRGRIAASNMSYDQHLIHLTVSVGVVQRRPEESSQPLLSRVDALLYKAKRTGKNRVIEDED